MAVELNSTTLVSDGSLVYYYRFEGNSNSTVGSANGTDTSITYSAGNGVFGQGAGFVAASSSKIAYSAKLVPPGAKSIIFWIKTTNTGDNIILDQSNRTSTNNGTTIDFGSGGSGKITFFSFKGVGGDSRFSTVSNGTINDGNPHLVGCTWDGTTGADKVKIWIDGVVDKTDTADSTEASVSTDNTMLGRQSTSATTFADMAIDDLAIFSRELVLADFNLLLPSSSLGSPIFFGNTAIA